MCYVGISGNESIWNIKYLNCARRNRSRHDWLSQLAWILFFRLYLHYRLSCVYNCEGQSCLGETQNILGKEKLPSPAHKTASRYHPFSSPKAAILLVSTENHDMWPGPTPEACDSRTSRYSAHALSQVWQIWLVLVSIYCVNKAIQNRNVVGPGQRSWFSVLTKRIAVSEDENWYHLGVNYFQNFRRAPPSFTRVLKPSAQTFAFATRKIISSSSTRLIYY